MEIAPHTSGQLRAVGEAFAMPGGFVEALPHGSGHINDTYCAVYQNGAARARFIHQRVNHEVFKDVPKLMENIVRVTSQAHAVLEAREVPDRARRALRVIPTLDGASFHRDPEGNFWRTYDFIEGAVCHDRVDSPEQAREAARLFGAFQCMASGLEGHPLHETVPGFHHTRSRFNALLEAVRRDAAGRASAAEDEVRFVREREKTVDVLLDMLARDELPMRVTHNDTKLNNVMLDARTGEGLCVIDLDTVMPGLVHYDFGDMVRTGVSPAPEDETDLRKVAVRMEIFEALARGYLSTAGEFLTPAEKAWLAFSGKLITLEIGIRFLADFLNGDVYFKIHRDGHNLDRCRAQFKLVECIEAEEDAMRRLVDSIAP